MQSYVRNKTSDYFFETCKMLYAFGLPYMWAEDTHYPKISSKLFNFYIKFINYVIYAFVLLEIFALYTQKNLTEKQKGDGLIYAFSHPMVCIFHANMVYHKDSVKKVLFRMAILLKEFHNDEKVERDMIKKARTYSIAFVWTCVMSVVLNTFSAVMQIIRVGATFTTVVTAWPDVEDHSSAANAARIVAYIIWWAFIVRVFALYILIVTLICCLSYQFRNIQSYFCKLSEIFESIEMNDAEKESKYAQSFKVGVKIHVQTLQCTKSIQKICGTVISGQIVFNVILIAMLMSQMMNSAHTIVNTIATVTTAVAVLISTGFFMWNAGDVTIEASGLANAIYNSGWENCTTPAVRNLVVITISNGQKPVLMRGFGVIGLSYQSYLSIVKSSYSIFSVIY